MKIAYAHPAILPSQRANSVQVMRNCAAFAEAGHVVTLLSPGFSDFRLPAGKDLWQQYGVTRNFSIANLHVRKVRGLTQYLYTVKCLAALRQLRPDLVYARHIPTALAAATAGYKVTVELHLAGDDLRRADRILLRGLFRSPNFRRLIAVSRPIRNWFLENYALSEDQVILAPNMAPLPMPGDTAAEHADSRVFRVGYIGQLCAGRGIEMLLECAGLRPAMELHIVGGSSSAVEEYRRAAPGNVVFHGFVNPSEIHGVRARCDALVAPYQEETLTPGGTDATKWMSPTKIMEYMSSGIPVVASDLPAVRDLLEDGETALLCPPSSASAWVAALDFVRDNRDAARTLAANALREYRHLYTPQARAARVLA